MPDYFNLCFVCAGSDSFVEPIIGRVDVMNAFNVLFAEGSDELAHISAFIHRVNVMDLYCF